MTALWMWLAGGVGTFVLSERLFPSANVTERAMMAWLVAFAWPFVAFHLVCWLVLTVLENAGLNYVREPPDPYLAEAEREVDDLLALFPRKE